MNFGLRVLGQYRHRGPTAALVASTYFLEPSDATTPITSQPIDTTGANFIAVVVECFLPQNFTFSDNKSNVWTQLPTDPGHNQVPTIFFSINPTVGTGHTFTASSSGSPFGNNMMVAAFSGVNANPFEAVLQYSVSPDGSSEQPNINIGTNPGGVAAYNVGDLVIFGAAIDGGGTNAMIASSVDTLTITYALDNANPLYSYRPSGPPAYPGGSAVSGDFEGHIGMAYGFVTNAWNVPAWDQHITYANNELALDGGQAYQSLTNGNVNHQPSLNVGTDWAVFPQAWSSVDTYSQGEIVSHSGSNYVSLSAFNTNNTPGGTGWWAPVTHISAPRWTMSPAWNSGSWASGDCVNYQGSIYKNTTGSNPTNPVTDAGANWSAVSVSLGTVVAVFSTASGAQKYNPLEYTNVGQQVEGSTTIPAVGSGLFSAWGDGDILIQGLGGLSVGGPMSINDSYTIADNIGSTFQSQACLAYKVATSNAQDAPTWTATSNPNRISTTMAGFKAYGSASLVAHTNIGGSSVTPITTSAIDTTGAQLLVISTSIYTSGATGQVAVSDSAGNVWYPAGARGPDFGMPQIWYCYNPITSATHTFTATDLSNSGASLAVAAFSGIYV